MMGDPMLGIKMFCVLAALYAILHIIQTFIASSRAIDKRLDISNLEGIAVILKFFVLILMPVMLLWSALAWIFS